MILSKISNGYRMAILAMSFIAAINSDDPSQKIKSLNSLVDRHYRINLYTSLPDAWIFREDTIATWNIAIKNKVPVDTKCTVVHSMTKLPTGAYSVLGSGTNGALMLFNVSPLADTIQVINSFPVNSVEPKKFFSDGAGLYKFQTTDGNLSLWSSKGRVAVDTLTKLSEFNDRDSKSGKFLGVATSVNNYQLIVSFDSSANILNKLYVLKDTLLTGSLSSSVATARLKNNTEHYLKINFESNELHFVSTPSSARKIEKFIGKWSVYEDENGAKSLMNNSGDPVNQMVRKKLRKVRRFTNSDCMFITLQTSEIRIAFQNYVGSSPDKLINNKIKDFIQSDTDDIRHLLRINSKEYFFNMANNKMLICWFNEDDGIKFKVIDVGDKLPNGLQNILPAIDDSTFPYEQGKFWRYLKINNDSSVKIVKEEKYTSAYPFYLKYALVRKTDASELIPQ